ncbi:hypothetical protein CAter282_3777 [Collimonas arenae]|uniref:Uncharacterized protein n=1 Tax=Collimonas arenae TaxID=279058 RepID=A0A127QNQ3_9BURK|nr:hypothetical protein CAter10_4125 [Collimonas arenae]AMP11455.1 hypothetical protein CAter282_3777 [Collimonas arenae]
MAYMSACGIFKAIDRQIRSVIARHVSSEYWEHSGHGNEANKSSHLDGHSQILNGELLSMTASIDTSYHQKVSLVTSFC